MKYWLRAVEIIANEGIDIFPAMGIYNSEKVLHFKGGGGLKKIILYIL